MDARLVVLALLLAVGRASHVVYLGSDNNGVHAYDTDTRAAVLGWPYTTIGVISADASPAIGTDGTVYIGSDDDKLYAINPDGTLNCTFTTNGDIRSAPSIAEDGTIYIGSNDEFFYAVNPDCSQKWNTSLSTYFHHGGAAIASDGTIYIGTSHYPRDDHVYALHPDNGTVLWNYSLPIGAFSRSSPGIALDGTIFVGYENAATLGALVALYPNGTEKWEFPLNASTDTGPFGSVTPMAIGANGVIYVAGKAGAVSGNKLYALNQTDGDEIWAFGVSDRIYSSPAIATDGTIYFGTHEGDTDFYAVSPNGTKKWSITYSTNNIFVSSPAIGPDGTIYLTSYTNEELYAINPNNGSQIWVKSGLGKPTSPSISHGVLPTYYSCSRSPPWCERCPIGTHWSGPDVGNCTEINQCDDDPCSIHANCTHSLNNHTCTCNAGYEGSGTVCTEINNCNNTDPIYCSGNATCNHSFNNDTCECHEGFTGNGFNCTKINECNNVEPVCSGNATCVDLINNHTCHCKDGFTGDGYNCTEINECAADPCSPNATCINLINNFTCTCNEGYTGNGFNCTLIPTPPPPGPTPPPPSPPSPPESPDDDGLSVGAIVGIAVGVATLAALLAYVAWVRRSKKTHKYEPISVADAIRTLLPPS